MPIERAEREGVTSWDLLLDGRRRYDLRITLILDPGSPSSAGHTTRRPSATPSGARTASSCAGTTSCRSRSSQSPTTSGRSSRSRCRSSTWTATPWDSRWRDAGDRRPPARRVDRVAEGRRLVLRAARAGEPGSSVAGALRRTVGRAGGAGRGRGRDRCRGGSCGRRRRGRRPMSHRAVSRLRLPALALFLAALAAPSGQRTSAPPRMGSAS